MNTPPQSSVLSPQSSLDPRAWLLWGAAATLPPLLGRNPFVLLATLLAVLGVRAAWAETGPGAVGWRALLRLALLAAAVGVLFNVLTAHVGDRVLLRLPDALPIVGGPLTLNALVYGLLGGAAVTTLVLVGTTLGVVLDWAGLLRLLPPRFSTVAVAGSIAWAFVPQTAAAFVEIREAQSARGHRPRNVRDLLPLLVPLLAGGLERAMTLAEALEARAFGAPLGPADTAPPRWRAIATILGLTASTLAAYLLAVRRPAPAAGAIAVAAVATFLAGREPGEHRHRPRRTRYREPTWRRAESIVAAGALVALLAEGLTLGLDPAAFAYDPYPSLVAPRVGLPLLAGLAGLLAPVAVAP